MSASPKKDRLAGQPPPSRVYPLPIAKSDVALVTALRAGRADAPAVLYDRYSTDVERLLYRVLGPDPEISDLLHDVFVAVLGSIGKLRDPQALRGWITGITVRTARKAIVKRQRWRRFTLLPPSQLPEREASVPPAEVSEALRCTYEVLAKMPVDQRVPFALRHVDAMELTAVAQACGVSLATIKRRLSKAQRTFRELAKQSDVLGEWLDGGEQR